MQKLAGLFLLTLLAGCVTTEEQRAQADDTKCRSYGVAPGSPPYVHCRMQLDHDRSDRQIATGGSAVGNMINLGERLAK